MIGLGSGSGSSDTGINSLTNLLAIISDPVASKARLEELATKNIEAKTALEKLVSLNNEVTQKQAEIATAQASLKENDARLAAKENNLKAREIELMLGKQTYTVDKQNFDNVSAAKEAEFAARATMLTKAEQDSTTKYNNAMAEMDKVLADRQAKLEATYAERLAASAALQTEANKNRDAAVTALAAAEEKKALYEKRLDALQKVIQSS